MQHTDGDGEGLQSLLEPKGLEKERPGTSADREEDIIASIRKAATSAGEFYEQVQRWTRIPRVFATMKDNERELITPSSLHRWLRSELRRPGILPSDEPLDEELVEYVAGLLEHPDFCQPDLLVLELHEFLGDSVTVTLWKFLVVEIALHSAFKSDNTGLNYSIQTHSTIKGQELATQKSSPKTTPVKRTAIAMDETAERDYKRRRSSYRGKVGTKTGPAAFREMIQKHMVGLSIETDRELVQGGGFQEDQADKSINAQQTRRDTGNWRDFTDALEKATQTSTMSQRFADPSGSGNNNNFLSDRSSTRSCKPPGGSSTMGSLIFGGSSDSNQSSYLDDRKSRRFNPQREVPEHNNSNNDIKNPNPGAADMSYYAKPSAAQEQRDRLAVAPGAVSREMLSQPPTSLAVVRRGNHPSSSSDYFANGMGGQDDGNNQMRRTRRMFSTPGGNSTFKLG
ncbi:unnamed protein product [Phytophthora fragariaefolia]|uniref:Unnamed protein product n=1 Tax=Phytophthora fragariaefolia TaxID=1490495 RepID=A0A9W6Y3X3_9STRA|nr:unnamed protein product [Phytophthora fragariaefolia]